MVAVAGLTPQVITETLYYLTQVKKPPSQISKIYVITTAPGKREIALRLLDPERGEFFRFCREYGIDASSIAFDEESIVVLADSTGNPLNDIRTTQENEMLANQIIDFIREQTNNPNAILHCSVAGGRKTMSVYLAFALMLFGREQDTLSHVLVDEQAEANKTFFPHKMEKRRYAVDLAEIPYPRLRNKIEYLFGKKSITFSEMIEAVQKEIDATPTIGELEVNLKERWIKIGTYLLKLNPKHIALYALFAERRRNHGEKGFIHLKGEDSIVTYGDEIKKYIAIAYPPADPRSYKLRPENTLQDISKINKKIEDTLSNPAIAYYYKILPYGGKRVYGATRYGINLHPTKIKPLAHD